MLQKAPTEESIEDACAHPLAVKYQLVNNSKSGLVQSTKELTRH